MEGCVSGFVDPESIPAQGPVLFRSRANSVRIVDELDAWRVFGAYGWAVAAVIEASASIDRGCEVDRSVPVHVRSGRRSRCPHRPRMERRGPSVHRSRARIRCANPLAGEQKPGVVSGMARSLRQSTPSDPRLRSRAGTAATRLPRRRSIEQSLAMATGIASPLCSISLLLDLRD
jgi:hypothetical protein